MKKFAILGRPIAHSKSPQIHQCFAENIGIQLSYERILVAEEDGFVATIMRFQQQGGNGVNVTAPCKEDAFKWVTDLSERAQLAGAVNTIVLNTDGTSLGDNTDGVGFIKDIKDFQGWNLRGKRILILGAGGAVRGILQPLLLEQPALVMIANRTLAKAQNLAESFKQFGAITFSSFADCATEIFDVVINSIPISAVAPGLPLISADTHCYDLVYSGQLTPFLQAVSALGATKIADGLGMLVEQAAEAFYIWYGIYPDTAKARALLHPSWENNNDQQ